MKCPHCSHDEDRVLDSRPVRDGAAIRRRRECASCQHRFTTYEYVETGTFSVVKKDGRREPFQRDKLVVGLAKACEKRPVPMTLIEETVDRIETDLVRTGRAEVKSSDVGARVLEALRLLDPVAYVRFASVYLNFSDIRQFQETIRQLHESMAARSEPGSEAVTEPAAEPGSEPATEPGTDLGTGLGGAAGETTGSSA